ncbi:hypothetical protein NQ314_007200 [Rhamnusium bicolor]|uniref:BRK domain-containing protein n=1 Tax=Rhamnusium bicolor TaxID=1586634 RepID=A0AAV8YQY0_9CUCU|nr:hypothetical protein NQ314_007200 [Rhamnusium bicolor]
MVKLVVVLKGQGNMLTGNKAPSAANLEQWLKEHPGYEVVRSGGKVVTAKVSQIVLLVKKYFFYDGA